MRPIDLLILPLASLRQQKLRTILTTLGVVFGAFVLAASLSIGEGVQETIARESRKVDVSKRVDVYPKWNQIDSKVGPDEVKVEGTMSPPRRERLRKAITTVKRATDAKQVRTLLDPDRLAKLAAIPHVVRTVPMASQYGFAILGDRSEGIGIAPALPDQESRKARIVAGRDFDAPDQKGVILDEHLAYRLGLHDDDAVERAIGKPLRLEIRTQQSQTALYVSIARPKAPIGREESDALAKVQARLPGALDKLLSKSEAELLEAALTQEPSTEADVYSEDFPIIGVLRDATEEERKKLDRFSRNEADVIMPYATAAKLYFKSPGLVERSVDRAALTVDEEKNVKDVVKQVEDFGLSASAAIEFIEREQFIYTLIFGGMTCVAGVALLVSALGIANTTLMSVLERTREIGIMKAVGADNRHLQTMFLVEGALIGGVGGLVGLLLAYLASFPGDAWVRAMVQRDIKIELTGSIFVFPGWIALTVLGFTILVTTLAALYPARHAARVDPVKALRHE